MNHNQFSKDLKKFIENSESNESYVYYIDSCDSNIECDDPDYNYKAYSDYPEFKYAKECNGDNIYLFDVLLIMKAPAKTARFKRTVPYDFALVTFTKDGFQIIDTCKKTIKEIEKYYGVFSNYIDNFTCGEECYLFELDSDEEFEKRMNEYVEDQCSHVEEYVKNIENYVKMH